MEKARVVLVAAVEAAVEAHRMVAAQDAADRYLQGTQAGPNAAC